MTKKQLFIFALVNILMFIGEYYYFRIQLQVDDTLFSSLPNDRASNNEVHNMSSFLTNQWTNGSNDQEGVRSSIVQTPDETYIEVRATRLKN